MSYNYLTQYNSPSFTPSNQVINVWGKPRTIEAIAIHWWDDPANNPSFEGVVNLLCNPARQASAHFVATGTGRRVACLVNLDDASWATGSANPYTISIECDPRCRDEDYDVVAEVIAQIRQVYGDLPLIPHRDVMPTRCPGNYDLGRLDREAKVKIALPAWDWGHVENPKPEQNEPIRSEVQDEYEQNAQEPIPEPLPVEEKPIDETKSEQQKNGDLVHAETEILKELPAKKSLLEVIFGFIVELIKKVLKR